MRLVVTESTSRESHWSLEMQLIGLSILMGIVLYFWCMFLNAAEPTIHPPTEPATTAVSVDASPEALENIIAKSQKLYDEAARHSPLRGGHRVFRAAAIVDRW